MIIQNVLYLGSLPNIKMSSSSNISRLYNSSMGLYKRTSSTTNSVYPVYQLEGEDRLSYLFVDNADHWCVYKEVNQSARCYLSSTSRPLSSYPTYDMWDYW